MPRKNLLSFKASIVLEGHFYTVAAVELVPAPGWTPPTAAVAGAAGGGVTLGVVMGTADGAAGPATAGAEAPSVVPAASAAAAGLLAGGATGGWVPEDGTHCFVPFSPPSQA